MDYYRKFLVQTVNLICSLRTDDNLQVPHSSRGPQLNVNLLPPECDPAPEGRVLDEDSRSCVCENVQECSAGYVFDPETCQCVCKGRISKEAFYDRLRECKQD